MATQIAATPVLRGKEAYAVLEESKKKPTPVSRRGIEFLKNKFRLRVYDNFDEHSNGEKHERFS